MSQPAGDGINTVLGNFKPGLQRNPDHHKAHVLGVVISRGVMLSAAWLIPLFDLNKLEGFYILSTFLFFISSLMFICLHREMIEEGKSAFQSIFRILFIFAVAAEAASVIGIVALQFTQSSLERILPWGPISTGIAISGLITLKQTTQGFQDSENSASCYDNSFYGCTCNWERETFSTNPESNGYIQEMLSGTHEDPWTSMELSHMNPFPRNHTRRISSSTGSISSDGETDIALSGTSDAASDDSGNHSS